MSQAETSNEKGVRWGWIISGLVVLIAIASFFLRDMEGSVQYYMTVSEYRANQQKYDGKKLKLAGKVKAGSLTSAANKYDFVVYDLDHEVKVTFLGLSPDTFKEGAEVVVEGKGRLDDRFEAKTLMAKCASKYESSGPSPLEQMRKKSVH